MRFTCNPTVWQLEWPSKAWKQMCLSGLCSSNPLGNSKGHSFSLSARTWDYVGEIRQKGLSVETGKRLDFCLTEQSHPISPEDFFPAWLTDCPAAVMTLSKYTVYPQRKREGWNQLFFYQIEIKYSMQVWQSVLLYQTKHYLLWLDDPCL